MESSKRRNYYTSKKALRQTTCNHSAVLFTNTTYLVVLSSRFPPLPPLHRFYVAFLNYTKLTIVNFFLEV